MATQTEYLWKDRKRTFLGLPWSFTKYRLTEDKLLLQAGLFTTQEDEVRLYRVLDMSLKRTIWQKIFNIGTIFVISADKTLPEFELKNVKNPGMVKELLSETVERCRMKKKVTPREFMSSDADMESYDYDDDNHDHGYN